MNEILDHLKLSYNSSLIIETKHFDLLIEKHEDIDLYVIEYLFNLFKNNEISFLCFNK